MRWRHFCLAILVVFMISAGALAPCHAGDEEAAVKESIVNAYVKGIHDVHQERRGCQDDVHR